MADVLRCCAITTNTRWTCKANWRTVIHVLANSKRFKLDRCLSLLLLPKIFIQRSKASGRNELRPHLALSDYHQGMDEKYNTERTFFWWSSKIFTFSLWRGLRLLHLVGKYANSLAQTSEYDTANFFKSLDASKNKKDALWSLYSFCSEHVLLQEEVVDVVGLNGGLTGDPATPPWFSNTMQQQTSQQVWESLAAIAS